ncbi:MAG TPA: ribosome maturation factor RimM [Candidatus Dormibacteraeota bacterium]
MTRPADASPPLLRAAHVRRPHGVRGELRVEPLGGDAARFVVGLRLRVETGERTLVVSGARPTGDGDVLLSLEGVTSREAADLLRDVYLCVEAGDARSLGDDEWFVHQLVGLRAVTPEGATVGAVEDVEEYTAQEVLVIRDGDRVHRIPMVRAFVERVDLAAGVVVVRPWEEV